jgi:hypothetical protein
LNKWYEIYFIKWWIRKMWFDWNVNILKEFKFCESGDLEDRKIIDVWSRENKEVLSIPYIQISDNDIKNIINETIMSWNLRKNTKIVLKCDPHEWLNCSVWRESMWLILKSMWFLDFCLSPEALF